MKIYDTRLRKKIEFVPIENNLVRMYTCGPTVYKDAHIGNYRTYMFEDLLRRTLKYLGYDVIQVMNITDVEDKTIRESREKGVKLSQITEPVIKRFFEDLDTLNIERAEHYPHATDHIDEMIELVQDLLDKDYAYKADGSIYFSISKLENYGKLSGMKMEGLTRGVRIDHDEYERDDFRDFALWKGWTEEDGDVWWDAPFGRGRPGWHIECSAMSMKYLGKQFDLHTGGVDNIFPHHENEIAQSEASTGQKFVRHWMHSAHLNWRGEKMSKSLGNQVSLRDLIERGFSARAIRFALLTTHYRMGVPLSDSILESADNSLERLDSLRIISEEAKLQGEIDVTIEDAVSKCDEKFRSALSDDLAIAEAMASLFNLVSDVHRRNGSAAINRNEGGYLLSYWRKVDKVLGFLFPDLEGLDNEVEELVRKRLVFRKEKNFAEADKIRDKLTNGGYQLKDDSEGTMVIWSQGNKKITFS